MIRRWERPERGRAAFLQEMIGNFIFLRPENNPRGWRYTNPGMVADRFYRLTSFRRPLNGGNKAPYLLTCEEYEVVVATRTVRRTPGSPISATLNDTEIYIIAETEADAVLMITSNVEYQRAAEDLLNDLKDRGNAIISSLIDKTGVPDAVL